jgi:hypothetical protein
MGGYLFVINVLRRYTNTMSQEQFTNRSDSSSNQNLDTKSKDYKVNKSKVDAIRSYSGKIINSRKQLEDYLLTKGIKLVTSFSEFVKTNSFVESSYVVYVFQSNSIENLSEFVQRNPQFAEIVVKIELELQEKAKLES